MRSTLRRYAFGTLLVVAGLAMLFAGASAIGYLADETLKPVASSTTTRTASEGLALDASVALDTPLVPLDPIDLHTSPAALESLPVPGASIERDDLDAAAGGLGLDTSLSLAGGSHRAKTQTAPATVATASMRAALAPATAPAVVVAAALAIGGLLAYFWGSIKAGVVAPIVALYAKISRAEVFDNNVRERIFSAIRANPGVSASDLSRVADVSWGTTIYHLDVLEQTRMVTSLRNGRYRRYFENGANLTTTKEAVAVLQNAVTAGVVATIKTRPGATQKELAAATSMTPQALHWHLTRLVATGLVRKEREGRVVRHFPASAL